MVPWKASINHHTKEMTVLDINAIVQEEMQKIEASGKVAELIQKGLEKTIENAVGDSLRWSGGVGKRIQQKLEEALNVNIDRIDFQSAGIGLLALIEAAVNNHMTAMAHPVLERRLAELFKAAPATIGLQDLIEEYKKDVSESDREHSPHIALVIQNDRDGWLTIGLNPKHKKRLDYSIASREETIRKTTDCEITMHCSKNGDTYEFLSIWFGEHTPKSTQNFLPTCMYGFTRRLYQMYAAGTRLVIPSFEPDDYWLEYEESD